MNSPNVKSVYRSIRKAKRETCPKLSPEQEQAPQEMFARMNRVHDFLKPQVTVDGVTAPANRMTINECRWVILDAVKSGRRLRG